MTHKQCPRCGYESTATSEVISAVLDEAAEDHGVTVEEITRRCRDDGNGSVWAARLCAYERLRWEFHLPLKRLGQVFGGRDHSTLIHWQVKLNALRAGRRSGWQGDPTQ